MRKIKKLITKPIPFLRDYLNKRCPITLNELGITLDNQLGFVNKELEICHFDLNPLMIDVVFTWVDHTDKRWYEKLNDYRTQHGVNHEVKSADMARFTSHDEIKYSLWSVKTFLPWVNRIFVVTDNQSPDWLANDPQVTIVDHTEIIEPCYLPTFNSHVIEANLHKIAGLSENFIYFNDDVFVARSLPASHFFKGNGLASLFIGKKNIPIGSKRLIKTATYMATENSRRLLDNAFGLHVDRRLIHTYVPLKKSILYHVDALFASEIAAFQVNKFRGENDLNVATFLAPWLAYYQCCAYPNIDICYYFNIRSNAAKTYYKTLLDIKAHCAPFSFCANDFESNHDAISYKTDFKQFLIRYFGVTL